MPSKRVKKGKGPPPNAWGLPGNPPPKSPGRPPLDKMKEIIGREPGIPERLAALRAALRWNSKHNPTNGMVRFYVVLQRRSPREFQAAWDKMEREWAELKVSREAPAVSKSGAEGGEAVKVEPDAGSQRAEELLEEFLDRHLASAVAKTGGL